MNSPMAVRRNEERFPVHLRYDHEEPQRFAKGGLAKSAMAVKKAGRMGDTELVHVNKAEFEEMKRQYGEPTINPETGQPEFFLGFLKKLLPIALSFVPGIGPIAGAAIGAGMGALDGGGIKGALGGALGGIAPSLGSVGQLAAGAAQGALAGGGWKGALAGGIGAGLNNRLASPSKAPVEVSSMPAAQRPSIANATNNPITNAPGAAGVNALAAKPNDLVIGSSVLPGGAQNLVSTQGQPGVPAKAPSFWDKNFLGIKGLPNKVGIPLGIAGIAALASGGGGGGDSGPPDQAAQDKFLNPVFKGSGRAPTGFYGDLAPTSANSARRPIEDYYRAGSMPEYSYFDYVKHLAKGGPASDMAVVPSDADGDEGRGSFAVHGPGDGRSDHIPAKLSDGEYVMDAETVAMLGNGSTKAGADKLDALRVKLRKHKGKALAQGKISPNAKEPHAYLAGGRS